jgi:ligand-binding sensor domain-containing protein
LNKIKKLIFLLIFIPAFISAQNEYTQFNHIDIENKTPTCITQDAYGYIWIGTNNGLMRYNGYTNKVFYHNDNDTTSIAHNYIIAILSDSEKKLWSLGLNMKLNLFNYETEIFTNYTIDTTISLNVFRISKIIEDKNNQLWINTEKGLFTFNKTSKKTKKIFSSDTLLAPIYINKENKIWMWADYIGLLLYCWCLK